MTDRSVTASLSAHSARLRAVDGRVLPAPADRWFEPVTSAERHLLARAIGPVLDIGCGPARHALVLAESGIVSLGIDISLPALAIARKRGAPVLHRSIFDRIPGHGRWGTALLLDGNVGIGGSPAVLLRRVTDLLRPSGRALVELGVPGSEPRRHTVRLEHDGRAGPWFGWAEVGVDALDDLARATPECRSTTSGSTARAGSRASTHELAHRRPDSNRESYRGCEIVPAGRVSKPAPRRTQRRAPRIRARRHVHHLLRHRSLLALRTAPPGLVPPALSPSRPLSRHTRRPRRHRTRLNTPFARKTLDRLPQALHVAALLERRERSRANRDLPPRRRRALPPLHRPRQHQPLVSLEVQFSGRGTTGRPGPLSARSSCTSPPSGRSHDESYGPNTGDKPRRHPRRHPRRSPGPSRGQSNDVASSAQSSRPAQS